MERNKEAIKKENFSKWRARGIDKKEVDKIRERIRSQAKTILKKKHLKEYNKIVKKLREKELKRNKAIISKEDFETKKYLNNKKLKGGKKNA